MRLTWKRGAVPLAALGLTVLLTAGACDDDSDVVDANITKAAKNFEVQRRITVVNGITDKYLLTVEGRCNVEPSTGKIWVTCKVADGTGLDSYKRQQVYLSDNVTVIVEQGEPIQASAYHYRMTFKPQAILPDPDFRGSSEDTPLADENQQ